MEDDYDIGKEDGRKEREDEIIKIIDKWFVTDAKGLTITNLIKLVEQIKEQKQKWIQ